jgi:hypothetical protein
MLYSLAYIFRRPDLNRVEFRRHYETRHAPLAQALLPRFLHYVRNHVIDSAGPMACPDSVSEFGFADEAQMREVRAILGDERGKPLLEDELRFMDKPKNRSFLIQRWDWGDADALGKKYILWPDAAAPALWSQRLAGIERIKALDPALQRATLCVPTAGDNESCWLCWTHDRPASHRLWDRCAAAGLALRSCATVEEIVGYPASVN